MSDAVRDGLESEAREIESAKLAMSTGTRLLREKRLRLRQLNLLLDSGVSVSFPAGGEKTRSNCSCGSQFEMCNVCGSVGGVSSMLAFGSFSGTKWLSFFEMNLSRNDCTFRREIDLKELPWKLKIRAGHPIFRFQSDSDSDSPAVLRAWSRRGRTAPSAGARGSDLEQTSEEDGEAGEEGSSGVSSSGMDELNIPPGELRA